MNKLKNMSGNIINEHTDEDIKNYLAEEKANNPKQLSDFDFENNNKNIFKNKKVILAVIFLIVLFVLSLFLFLRNGGKQSFDKTEVKINIQAPENIASGEDVVFDIKYENNTEVNLNNVKISFFIPKEFLFISSDREILRKEEAVITWDVGKVSIGEIGNIKLFGKIIGEKNSEYNFDSKISYTPENFNYEFKSYDSQSMARVKIAIIPFDLNIQSPESIVSGNNIEYIIKYNNTSNRKFKLINIKAQLPDGFEHEIFQPKPSEKKDNLLVWNIENVDSNKGGEISIKGKINTNENIERNIDIVLSASEDGNNLMEYERKSAIIKIKKVPISIKQFINGQEEYFAIKGEELEYKIKFKNESDEEIRGIVVNSVIDGFVDFNSLNIINGSYNKDSNKIIWSAFNIPRLASFSPGQEEEVSFKIRVKDYIEIKKETNKNFAINNEVTISNFNFNSDSENIEKIISSNKNVIKLGASLFIRTKGYFNDDGRIKNFGNIPPEVNSKTEYLLHWNLSSLFNDIGNLRISAVLPDNVKWTGNFIKSNGKISFGDENNGIFIPEKDEENINRVTGVNENKKEELNQILEERFYYNSQTREVVWEIPKLDANTGIVSPVKEVVFQVSISPNEDDVGNAIKLINQVKAIGQDQFIQREITAFDSELTTKLPDDYSIGINEGIVVSNIKNND